MDKIQEKPLVFRTNGNTVHEIQTLRIQLQTLEIQRTRQMEQRESQLALTIKIHEILTAETPS